MSDSDEPGPSAALWKKSSAKTIVSFADDERTPLLSLSSATLHASTNAISRDKGKQVEVQIEDLATAAGKNIGKLLSRGEKLKDIHDKSENLENVGGLFRTHATKLTNTSWSSSIREKGLKYAYVGLVLFMAMITFGAILNSAVPRTEVPPANPISVPPNPPIPGSPGPSNPAPIPSPNGPICNCVCPPQYPFPYPPPTPPAPAPAPSNIPK